MCVQRLNFSRKTHDDCVQVAMTKLFLKIDRTFIANFFKNSIISTILAVSLDKPKHNCLDKY